MNLSSKLNSLWNIVPVKRNTGDLGDVVGRLVEAIEILEIRIKTLETRLNDDDNDNSHA